MTSKKINFVGIDLGTTYSCVGVMRDDKVEIITNDRGLKTTPSYVSFVESERYIGESAKEQLIYNMGNTIYDVKRLIGRRYNDPIVQSDLLNFPFDIVEGENGGICIMVDYMDEKKIFTPEDISAMILSKLKTDAELFLGESVEKAVITVPAYFNNAQREATKNAGRIAGLDVIRIINEPTAAGIAYNLNTVNSNEPNNKDKNILVYDLGGGTLDVTILTTNDGLLEVKSTSGNTHLGGEDFDKKITEFCAREFVIKSFKPKTNLSQEDTNNLFQKYSVSSLRELIVLPQDTLTNPHNDISEETQKYILEVIEMIDILNSILKNPQIISKLKTKCENAKKILSKNESTTIIMDSFYQRNTKMYDLKVPITKSVFESICSDEFNKCMEPVNNALKDANFKCDDIHDVVLIGGSTRIPKICNLLIEKFGNKLKHDINPDEAVAYGATVQAAILCREENDKTSVNDIVLVDVVSLSLGVKTAGNIMATLIPRNTQIPCSAEKIFTTYTDNQPAVTIDVYEGERTLTNDNEHIGSFELQNITPAAKGTTKIKVKFEVNDNGILTITAKEETNDIVQNNSKSITIKNTCNRLSEEQILKKIEESKKYLEEDAKNKANIESKQKLENYIQTMKKIISSTEFKTIIDASTVTQILNMLQNEENKLDDNRTTTSDDCDKIKKECESFLNPYINKFNDKLNTKHT